MGDFRLVVREIEIGAQTRVATALVSTVSRVVDGLLGAFRVVSLRQPSGIITWKTEKLSKLKTPGTMKPSRGGGSVHCRVFRRITEGWEQCE